MYLSTIDPHSINTFLGNLFPYFWLIVYLTTIDPNSISTFLGNILLHFWWIVYLTTIDPHSISTFLGNNLHIFWRWIVYLTTIDPHSISSFSGKGLPYFLTDCVSYYNRPSYYQHIFREHFAIFFDGRLCIHTTVDPHSISKFLGKFLPYFFMDCISYYNRPSTFLWYNFLCFLTHCIF